MARLGRHSCRVGFRTRGGECAGLAGGRRARNGAEARGRVTARRPASHIAAAAAALWRERAGAATIQEARAGENRPF